MRVYDRNLTGTTAAETSRPTETHEAERNAGASSSSVRGFGDRVELSSTVGRVSRALYVDGSTRAAHVQALAARYQSGHYHPDSLGTGRALISETLAQVAN